MCDKKNNQNKIDALTDNMISCMKIHEESDKKLVKRIRLMPEIKKNYDFVAKDETSIEANYFCDSFVEGADWRINSVWHDIKEMPENNRMILIIMQHDIPTVIGPDNTFFREEIKDRHIQRWAYVEDLKPNMEE